LNIKGSSGVLAATFAALVIAGVGSGAPPRMRTLIGILAVIAKQERVRLSEHTRAGLAVAKSNGRFAGRPRLKVQPAEIARLRASGLSLRAIGRHLHISEGSVRRLVSIAA
jgi:DNA invertase Pin-like site-specific DNA recombinase